MLATIEHRGPDGRGEFLTDDVQLGAVRLAILDAEGGHQPVEARKGSLQAVFNGELYDHGVVRQRLADEGHDIAGRGDSALLPHLYEESGSAFVEGLHGMFALALWDARERALLLARDRLGIKPLYWARTRDFLVFGSEIKAILASGLVETRIDRDAVDDLFSLSYPCPPRTMFAGIYELRPAHLMRARVGHPPDTPRRFWRAPFVPRGEHRGVDAREAAEVFADLLRAKVATHLEADVPVATYLSGGIDSSAITALAAEVRGEAPTTFSIGFRNPAHDEREYASCIASQLGAPNHAIVCGPETAHHYPQVLWHMELPLQFPLALPLALLSRAAASHGFPAVLTGEGADELLGGYDCFRVDKMRRLLDRPVLRTLRPHFYRKVYGWLGSPEGLVDHLLAVQSRSAREVEAEFAGLYPPWYEVWATLGLERDQLLSPGGHRARPIDRAPEGFDALVRPDAAALHPLDAGLALELESRLPSWILAIADRAAMANGVEARVPLLDHEVVEFLAPLPPQLKMRGFLEKALLREAMRGRLPERIRTRRKRPFYTPIQPWFFGANPPDYVEEVLSEGSLRDAGLFDPAVVGRMREQLRSAGEGQLRRMRLEWLLVLVLGTQLLHQIFVREGGAKPTAPTAGTL